MTCSVGVCPQVPALGSSTSPIPILPTRGDQGPLSPESSNGGLGGSWSDLQVSEGANEWTQNGGKKAPGVGGRGRQGRGGHTYDTHQHGLW